MTTLLRRTAAMAVLALILGGITWTAVAEQGDYATLGYSTPNGYSFWRVDSNGDLVPGADNTFDLGTAALSPANLFCDGTATIAVLSVTGSVSVGGQLGLLNQTTTQMLTLTPACPDAKAGCMIYSSTNKELCVSSGTAVGAWVQASTTTATCAH